MKFSNTYKFFSIALSFLILFSTLSLTIEKHFCGDVLIDVAIFTETEKCAMEVFEIEQAEIAKKSCCKDEIDVMEGITKITTNTFEDIETIQKQILIAYSYTYLNLYESLANSVIPHKDYSPPNLIKDIQVLDETYLI